MPNRRRRSLSQQLNKQRRGRRRGDQQGPQRGLQLEHLEQRQLLAVGPQLFAIRPDQGPLLQPGDVLHEAPREFNLLFKGGADIDESTINGNVRLVRSGHDGSFGEGNEVVVELGYVGLSEPPPDPSNPLAAGVTVNRSHIVLRPASSAVHNPNRPQAALPNDLYRIEVIGAGFAPLSNNASPAEPFNDGENLFFEFELDLGAQIIAVAPQPVSRATQQIAITGGAPTGTFTLRFAGQTTNPLNVATVTAADIRNTLIADITAIGQDDVQVTGAGAGPFDVTFRGQFAGEQVATIVVDDAGVANGAVTVSRQNTLSQAADQVVVYFNNDDLDPTQARDPRFYRLVDTGATAATGNDVTVLPARVSYDPVDDTAVLTFDAVLPDGTYRLDVGVADESNALRDDAIVVGTLFNNTGFEYVGYLGDINGANNAAGDVDLFRINVPAGATVTVTPTPDPGLMAALRILDRDGNSLTGAPTTSPLMLNVSAGNAGDLFVEVSNQAGSGAFLLNIDVAGNAISGSDGNTTFASATPLGTLGIAGLSHSAQIEPQGIAMPSYPGGEDEPGHRLIQPEQHLPTFGLGPSVPGPITIRGYNFPSSVGGFPNFISETEKRVVREIYETYGSLTGIQFREGGGTSIMKGDLKAADPTSISGPGGVAGLGGPGLVVLDFADFPNSNNVYGSGFFSVMFHEIGHSLGLGHSYDIPTVQGSGVPNEVLPGDGDVVHLNRLWRPDSTDIDLYEFDLAEPGRFTAEIVAERRAVTSMLDSVLTLYRENPDGSRDVIARNDNYFSNDSFLDIELEAGTYFLGVSSTGNVDYDPNIADSGFGGRTDGPYDLRLNLTPAARSTLSDMQGTQLDGDADGTPGGEHQFWFESSRHTIFVDKANDVRANIVDGNGQLTGAPGNPSTGPFDTISFAMQRAADRLIVPTDRTGQVTIADGDTFTVDDGINPALVFEFDEAGNPGLIDPLNHISVPFDRGADSAADVAAGITAAVDAAFLAAFGTPDVATATDNVVAFAGIANLDVSGSAALIGAPNLVRIVGNGGLDGNIRTLGDNRPYLVGLDNAGVPLPDGQSVEVPQGVTAMFEAGALLKMRKGNLDAGTSSSLLDRRGGAIQVLGTPANQVYLRSLRNDTIGGNSDGVGPAPAPGDFGGIVFRDDSDLETSGIFLNHVGHANINNGGGKVFVGSNEVVFTPIHMIVARPTVSFNTITNSADAAMSANPNSFDDAGSRSGPDIQGNFLSGSSINGLFVRIETEFGNPIEKLDVQARFDDNDIAHVITENLLINGAAGGPLGTQARLSGRLHIDPGVVVKLGNSRIEMERGAANLIAEGTDQRQVIFTSVGDDRFGGSGTFDTNADGVSNGRPGDWGGLMFNHVSSGSIDNALIAFGGGEVPIEGGFDSFNAIEVHQARLRLTNSTLQFNASGQASSGGNTARNGRGFNTSSVIHVSGSQPLVINNTIQDNAGGVLNINANALVERNIRDYGRATGPLQAFVQLADNDGPLVRLNRLDNNLINGMTIRGEELTTATVWDDTDVAHVLRNEVVLNNHHTFSGIRLKSSNSESLVVKLQGANAGITANGVLLEIDDRIGGSVHVIGTVGHPVIMTALADDSVGAGFTPEGAAMLDTNGDGLLGVDAGARAPQPGDWRSIRLDRYSNDRNVVVIDESEGPYTDGVDTNFTPTLAQPLGTLAPDEKSSDENSRLGFEVHGYVSLDDPTDVDVYSFSARPGTEVWFDIDDSSPALDPIIELVNVSGTVLARSIDNNTLSGIAQTAHDNPLLIGDFYTTNFRDPSMRLLLPGTGGAGTFFIRVRSNPQPDSAITNLDDGLSSGSYQLQVRLKQVDEFPGSTVRSSVLRFADVGIDVNGLPAHSLIVGETSEIGGSTFGNPQLLGNVLETDRAAVTVAGALTNATQRDFYEFSVEHRPGSIQSIGGVNDGGKTAAFVFDLDFADGAVRPDSSLYVYDPQGRLLLVGRESYVEDDQGRPGIVPDTQELDRGSLGLNDPFIGPVHLPEGSGMDYRISVSSNSSQASPLDQYFNFTPVDTALRLEPVNSITRVVEDHIGFLGYQSGDAELGSSLILPSDPDPLLDITDSISLQAHVREFDLGDVVLFVSSGNGDQLWTVNPFQGGTVTRVTNDLAPGNSVDTIQDIVIRSDGEFYGYRRRDNTAAQTQNNIQNLAGTLITIDGGNGALTTIGDDNVPAAAATQQPNGNNPIPTIDELTYTDDVDALTFDLFRRVGNTNDPEYDVLYSVREEGFAVGGAPSFNSKLYRGNSEGANGSVTRTSRFGFEGNIQPAGVTFAADVQGFADANNSGVVTIQSRAPGTAGNGITVIATQAGAGNAVTSANPATGVINVRLDNRNNAVQTLQTLVNLINAHGTAGSMVTAAVTGGNAATTITAGVSVFTLGGGNDGIDPLGPLQGFVTGLAYVGDQLFGVTSAGDFLSISDTSGVATRLAAPLGVSFQGLALGPQNVSEFDALGNETVSRYRNLLFAIANNGDLHAFDTAGIPQMLFDSDGDDVPDSATINTGLAGITGLAFSPLDFNLWHPTFRRGQADTNHGVQPLFDNSRDPGSFEFNVAGRDTNELEGGASFYFGLESLDVNDNDGYTYVDYEASNAQYGIEANALGNGNFVQGDLSSNPAIGDNYNLPGGALGSLETSDFSLEPYSFADKPTLYFNYFLNTENHAGSNINSDGNNPFRDSARVFISRDDGLTWELLTTNNSLRSTEQFSNDAELPAIWSDSSTEGLRFGQSVGNQQIQEMFDSTNWRQARVDLAGYAGESNLKLRFDFSTAGAMNDVTLGAIDASFGEFANATRSIRGQNNNFEGFYIDDIIIGFSERGEMATSSQADVSGSFNMPQPPESWIQAPEVLTGAYQVEVRRADDFAALVSEVDPDIAIGFGLHPFNNGPFPTYDTNERIVEGYTIVAPAGNLLADGMTFTVVGRTTRTFEFNNAGGVATDNVAVPFNAGMTDDLVAVAIRNAINSTVDFGVLAIVHTATTNRVSLNDAKNVVLPGGSPLLFEGYLRSGDSNRLRDQGQLLLENNTIANAASWGIEVTPGQRDVNGNRTYPGAAINFAQVNSDRIAPGVVIQNNVIVASEAGGGIRFAGEPNTPPTAVLPFGRIVNNTIFGGTPSTTVSQSADVIFLQDTTASMEPFIDEIVNQLLTMETAMQAAGISVRYGAVRLPEDATFFGGSPDPAQIQDITDFATFSAPGAPYPNLVNDTGGIQERGSEAVLEALNQFDPSSGATTFNYTPGSRIITVMITTENDDSVARQAEAIAALQAANAVFFGIIDPDNMSEGGGTADEHYRPLANATGGQILDIADFQNNPDVFFDAFVQSLIGVIGGGQAVSGIVVDTNASPTVLNNVVAGFQEGIRIGAGSGSTVLGSNAFRDNTQNVVGASLGSSPLLLQPSDPLFSNPFRGNFYPADGSPIVDSSLNSLQDRGNYVNFKTQLGIAQSPIFSPERDVFGQLRVDSVEDPLGAGSSVFKDRGAVDKADDERPYAELLIPLDNDAEERDRDPTDTVVYRVDTFLEEFSILLGDGPGPNSPFQGTGINERTVDIATETSDPDDPDATISQRAVRITANGQPLVEDIDYTLGYNANNNLLLLTPLSSLWEPNIVYEITLDNSLIQDQAGNFLRDNRPDGSTRFTIILGAFFEFDFGDAPDVGYGTLLNSDGARHVLLPEAPLFLGRGVDAETDGQPTLAADGDDRDTNFVPGTSPLLVLPSAPLQIRMPGGGATLTDGDSFTIDDGSNPLVELTFDLNANGVASGIAIPYYAADPVARVAQRIVDAILAEEAAGNLTGVVATYLGGNVLEIRGESGLNVDFSGLTGFAVSNRLPALLQVPAAGFADQQTFEIHDGEGHVVVFELEEASAIGLVTGDVAVPFTAGDSAEMIAAAIVAAIEQAMDDGLLDDFFVMADGDLIRLAPREMTVDTSDAAGITATVDLAQLHTLQIPGAGLNQIVDGQTLSIMLLNGGIPVTRVYEFDDTSGATGMPGLDDTDNIPIEFDGTAYSATVIAAELFASLDAELMAGTLVDLQVSVAGDTLELVQLARNGDDEDGVTFGKIFAPGQAVVTETTISVVASGPGLVDAWIDLNGNGQFDPEEQILTSQPVVAGLNEFLIDPAALSVFVTPGDTYARFRISETGGLFPNSIGIGGEVEDYLVRVLSNAAPTVVSAVAPISVLEDAADDVINLNNVFGDVDIANGNGDSLTLLFPNDMTSMTFQNLNGDDLLTASIAADGTMTIDYLANANGQTIVMLKAIDHGGLERVHSFSVSVQAVNDPPDVSIASPGQQELTILEGATPRVLTGIVVNDVDEQETSAPNNTLEVTLSIPAGQGRLSVNASGTSAIVTPGTPSEMLTIVGTEAAIDLILGRGVTYQLPDSNFNELNNGGPVLLTITADDQGRTGMPDIGETDSDTVIIHVTPVNDPPVILLPPGPIAMNEADPPRVINGIAVDDFDEQESASPNDVLRVTLSIPAGTGMLSVIAAGSATVTPSAGNTSIQIDGLEADIDAILAGGVTYTLPDDDFNSQVNGGPVPLTIRAEDMGSTGTGGPGVQQRVLNIDISPVNDAPVVTLPGGPLNYFENSPATAIDSTASITDVDSPNFGGGSFTVNIVVNQEATDQIGVDINADGDNNTTTGIHRVGSEVFFNIQKIGDIDRAINGVDGNDLRIDLTGQATVAAVEALARTITYHTTSDTPSELPRTVTFTVVDGDGTSLGGDDTGSATTTVNVTAVNDAPRVTISGQTLVYVENALAVPLQPGAIVVDPDSTNFNGGSLTATVVGNATTEFLSIAGSGVPGVGIERVGSQVLFNGMLIGSVDAVANGLAGASLTVNFSTAAATPQAAQALARAVAFFSADDNPLTARMVTFVVNDGLDDSIPRTTTIAITPVNDPPVIGLPSGPLAYLEDSPFMAIDPAASVTDPDSTDFFGGRLNVSFAAGGTVNDQLTILSVGGISTSGGSVLFNPGGGSVQIGSFSGGQDGSPLVVNLTSTAADPTSVGALLRAIAYFNDIGASTADRTVQFQLIDGDLEEDTGANTTTIQFTGIDDPMVVDLPGPVLPYLENDPPTIIDSTAVVIDVDTFDFAGGNVTASFTVGGSAGDQLGIADVDGITVNGSDVAFDAGGGPQVFGTVSGGADGADLVVALNNSGFASPMALQALARALTYANSSDNPSTVDREVTLMIFDGATGNGMASTSIVVTPVNDPPAILLPSGPLDYLENAPPTSIDAAAVLVDPDSPDLQGGSLTAAFTAGATANDALMIRSAGGISTSGVDVSFDAGGGPALIGTFSGGQSGTPLAVSLTTAAATRAAVEALVRAIAFVNTSDDPLANPRSFTMTLVDGDGTALGGGDTGSIVATVNVVPQNDAPVLTPVGGQTLPTVDEDNISTPISVATLLGTTISDLDSTNPGNANDPVGIAITGAVSSGTWQFSTDGGGFWNDVANASLSTSAALLLRGQDLLRFDGDDANGENATLTYRAWDQTGGSNGLQGTLFDAASLGFGGGSPFSLLSDLARIVVTSVNDAPTAANVGDPTFIPPQLVSAIDGGPPVNANFDANDVDNGETAQLIYQIVSQPSAGQVFMDGTPGDMIGGPGDPQFTFSSAGGFRDLREGEIRRTTFTYRATDPQSSSSNIATVTVTVTGVNDPPEVANLTIDASEDGPQRNRLLAAFDAEGDAVVFSLGANVTLGSCAITLNPADLRDNFTNNNGLLSFNPSNEFHGLAAGESCTLTITYTADDQTGLPTSTSLPGTITVVVAGVNDIPQLTDDSYVTDEDTPLVSDALNAMDVDVDVSDTLTVISEGTDVVSVLGASVQVLGDGTFTYDPTVSTQLQALTAAASPLNDTFRVTVEDSQGARVTQMVTVTVSGVNDAPTANPDFGATTEDSVFSENLLNNDTDPDAGETAGLSVTGAALASTMQADVTIGSSGLYNYDPRSSALLQALAVGEEATDTFVYTVRDQHLAEAQGTVSITVTGVNDAPVANTDIEATTEDVVVTIDALANDTDVDNGDQISVFSVNGTSTQGAAITQNANGDFVYDPRNAAALQALQQGQTVDDTFTYRISDLQGARSTGTVTITVTGINDAPVGVGDSQATDEDTVLSIGPAGVLANDTDVDHANDQLSVLQINGSAAAVGQDVGLPSGARLTLNSDGSFSYDPRTSQSLNSLSSGQTANDMFTYRVGDGASAALVPTTVTISVSGRNDVPVAAGDQQSTSEDLVLNVAAPGLLVNDTDIDGDALIVNAFSGASSQGAAVTVNADGSYSYNPIGVASLQALAAGEVAIDTFIYSVRDGNGGTAMATVTISVNGVNDAPLAQNDSHTIDEDSTLVVSGEGVLENDTDADENDPRQVVAAGTTAGSQSSTPTMKPGGGLAFQFASQLGAPVVINPDGTFTFDPTNVATFQQLGLGQTIVDRFVYTVGDSASPQATSTATVTITVEGRNDAPDVVNDAYSTNEDAQLVVPAADGVLSNPVTGDRDPEGTTLSASLVSSPQNGQLQFTPAGGFTYTPNANFNGVDSFTYIARDGSAVSTPATVTITVNPVNDPPSAADDQFTVNQNGSLTISAPGVLTNDTDVDGESLTAARITNPARGTLSLSADGSFTYTPNAGFFGTDSFQYDAVDATGSRSRATVTLNVENIHVWQNPANRLDVNADGFVTAQDVLILINWLNAFGPGPIPTNPDPGPPFRDVNGDDAVTAQADVTPVLNFLNFQPGGEGEGAEGAGTIRVLVDDGPDGETASSPALVPQFGLARDTAPLPGQIPFAIGRYGPGSSDVRRGFAADGHVVDLVALRGDDDALAQPHDRWYRADRSASSSGSDELDELLDAFADDVDSIWEEGA